MNLKRRLRFKDLQALGLVNNRATLANWIKTEGFPSGSLTGPNSRTWGEDEVEVWHASRPTARKPAPKRRKAKAVAAACAPAIFSKLNL